ncbi:MalY/PatB family protein [Anaerovibrio sp.]|uniref:MalY/PatB family protein n=1 Tax=Anaerovibrio sp. TaxID=1872532 RepID=UPI003F162413
MKQNTGIPRKDVSLDTFDAVIDRRNTGCLKYDSAAGRGYPDSIQPFWIADMDFQAPPQVLDELAKRTAHGIFGYTAPWPEYHAALAAWFSRHHGWQVSSEELVITPGVVFALAAAVRAFTEPDDGVIIQQPVYYPFSEVIKANGRRLINSSLVCSEGRYHIDFADFEKKIVEGRAKLFILCSPHNPVGRVWSRQELLRLADICLKHDVLIVADEIHHEFTRPGITHTVLAGLSEEIARHTITCTAPSKTFNLAGLQVSNIFIRDSLLRRRFRREVSAAGYGHPNALGLFACHAAYTHGEKWLEVLRLYLERNYQRTKEFLHQELPKVRLVEPEGTYLLWLDFRAFGLTDEQLDDIIIHKAGLWLDSGHIFGADGSGFQRMNIACPWTTLEKGLKSLAAAFKAM